MKSADGVLFALVSAKRFCSAVANEVRHRFGYFSSLCFSPSATAR